MIQQLKPGQQARLGGIMLWDAARSTELVAEDMAYSDAMKLLLLANTRDHAPTETIRPSHPETFVFRPTPSTLHTSQLKPSNKTTHRAHSMLSSAWRTSSRTFYTTHPSSSNVISSSRPRVIEGISRSATCITPVRPTMASGTSKVVFCYPFRINICIVLTLSRPTPQE